MGYGYMYDATLDRRRVHMCAVLYELAYTCKSPTYGTATAVPVQWYKHRAAYTDMPNMHPFVGATTRGHRQGCFGVNLRAIDKGVLE